MIHKLLISAVDNAKYVSGEAGADVDVDNLYVKTAVANDGPRMKRIRPAPMGRAFRYQRRLTHIVLSVAEREGAAGLVTKVEEPAVSSKVDDMQAAPKAAKKKASAPKTAKASAKKIEKPQAETSAAKETKAPKKAGKKA